MGLEKQEGGGHSRQREAANTHNIPNCQKGKEEAESVFDFTSTLLLQQDEAGGGHQVRLDTLK